MRIVSAIVVTFLLLCALMVLFVHPEALSAQYPVRNFPPGEKRDDEGVRLPNGKLQRDVILQHEHNKNLEDLRRIHELSGKLVDELEEQTAFVFSLQTLEELEELEKLSKQVKSRFKKR